MPRKNLIDFTFEEIEKINECVENGDFENPLYKEYKKTEKLSNQEDDEILEKLGSKNENTIFSKEETEESLKDLLDFVENE